MNTNIYSDNKVRLITKDTKVIKKIAKDVSIEHTSHIFLGALYKATSGALFVITHNTIPYILITVIKYNNDIPRSLSYVYAPHLNKHINTTINYNPWSFVHFDTLGNIPKDFDLVSLYLEDCQDMYYFGSLILSLNNFQRKSPLSYQIIDIDETIKKLLS